MSERIIELVLADIVGEYEQSIINERSSSPEYKSWERRSILKLRKALNSDLLAALKEAATVFRRYEKIHMDKGSLDGDAKAMANAKMAEHLEEAIDRAEQQP